MITTWPNFVRQSTCSICNSIGIIIINFIVIITIFVVFIVLIVVIVVVWCHHSIESSAIFTIHFRIFVHDAHPLNEHGEKFVVVIIKINWIAALSLPYYYGVIWWKLIFLQVWFFSDFFLLCMFVFRSMACTFNYHLGNWFTLYCIYLFNFSLCTLDEFSHWFWFDELSIRSYILGYAFILTISWILFNLFSL